EQLGIEPRTSPMLREHYTTKPQPHLDVALLIGMPHEQLGLRGSAGTARAMAFHIFEDVDCFPHDPHTSSQVGRVAKRTCRGNL
ncbi:hypothetical protein BDW75DRAFT_203128, partial [Aspergillus navahoensis]